VPSVWSRRAGRWSRSAASACWRSSAAETYANSHKSITTRAYPFRQDSLGLRLFGDGSVVKSMTVWKMGSMTD
jgi:hypothetical protein